MIQTVQTRRISRSLAWMLAMLLVTPILLSLTGCGNSGGDQTPTTSGSGGAMTSSNSVPPPPTSTAAPGTMAGNGMSSANTQPKQGMSTGTKVVLLAGAALLYYLYRKHQAAQQAQGATGQPQLYRSSNGGVYYRDPQNPQKVTWLTAPSQPMQVPADQVQQYAPNYQQYQGQAAPQAPAGQPQQSFTQFDPSLAGR